MKIICKAKFEFRDFRCSSVVQNEFDRNFRFLRHERRNKFFKIKPLLNYRIKAITLKKELRKKKSFVLFPFQKLFKNWLRSKHAESDKKYRIS